MRDQRNPIGCSKVPVAVRELSGVSAISAHRAGAAAVASGSMKAWGEGAGGKHETESYTPVSEGPPGVISATPEFVITGAETSFSQPSGVAADSSGDLGGRHR